MIFHTTHKCTLWVFFHERAVRAHSGASMNRLPVRRVLFPDDLMKPDACCGCVCDTVEMVTVATQTEPMTPREKRTIPVCPPAPKRRRLRVYSNPKEYLVVDEVEQYEANDSNDIDYQDDAQRSSPLLILSSLSSQSSDSFVVNDTKCTCYSERKNLCPQHGNLVLSESSSSEEDEIVEETSCSDIDE